jgi:hypothetical protein
VDPRPVPRCGRPFGLRTLDDSTLNPLFETAEHARYACCLTHGALAGARGERWAFKQLAEIDTWSAQPERALAGDQA